MGGREGGGAWTGEEREDWMDRARLCSVQTCGNYTSQKTAERQRRREEGERRAEACLRQPRNAAAPRNPSSQRDAASPSPWLRLAGWWGDAKAEGRQRVTRNDPVRSY